MKPPERWQSDIKNLIAFRNAFVELVNSAQMSGDWYESELAPKVSTSEWNRLRTEVATAAGVAAHSYSRAGGGTFTLKNAAYIMNNVDPITNWAMSSGDPEQMPPESVVASVETATGIATELRDQAKQREHGLIGLIGAFLRWPRDLREAVGPGQAQRRAAGAIGIFGQLVVAAVGGALAVGLAAGAVAVWQIIF